MKEKEINLLDMIFVMLSHWRSVLIAMVIGAILLGGMSYVKSYQAIQNTQQLEEKETVQDETVTEEKLAELQSTLDDSQQIAVLTAIDDEREYSFKKKYFEESIYMQMDAYNIAQREVVYDIQPGKGEKAQYLGTIYQDVVNGIGLYDWVEQHTGIEMAYSSELISIKISSSTPFTNGETSGSFGNDSLKISVIQADDDLCKELADTVKSYVEQQSENLVTKIGEHKLCLLSEASGRVMSTSVMNQQIEYRNALYALQSAIIAEKTAFTDEQKQYYNILTNEEELEDTDTEQEIEEASPLVAAKPQISKKYILLGAILFAFVYVAVLFMGYIFNSKLRINDEFQALYGVPQIGVVVKDTKKKLFLDKWIDNLRHYGKRKFTAEQSMELAFAAVKIAVVKNGLSSIGLLGCNLGAGADKICNELKAALEKEGIAVTVLNNVIYDAEAMEQIDTLKGAVLVEKVDSTLYNEITSELELLKRQEIPVLGGIIVE